jgi:hypothetical protein
MLLLRSGASADRRKLFPLYFQMAALCRDAATPITDDETASGFPERFVFRQVSNVAQAFGHDAQAWAKYQCQSRRANFQGDGGQCTF